MNSCAGSQSVCTPLEHATACEPARIASSGAPPEVVDCWLHVIARAKHVREGRRLSTESFGTGDALLTRLRKSLCDVYGKTLEDAKYQPFVSERIKEPEVSASTVPLLLHLPPAVAEVLSSPDRLLRPLTSEQQQEFDALRTRYNHFGGVQSEWVKYHNIETTWPLWEYVADDVRYVAAAIMAVGRAKDNMLRKITATCPWNFACWSPEDLFPKLVNDLRMLGAAILSTVFATGAGCHFALLNESQAFTSALLLAWMWEWQAGYRIRASCLPRHLWKRSWKSTTWIRPLYKRLAMGSTWAVFLLMLIHKAADQYALLCSPLLILNNFMILNLSASRLGLRMWSSRTGTVYIHVDDFVFMHQSEDVVNRAAFAVLSVLEEWGFVVVFAPSHRVTKVVGFDTASSPAGLEIPLARLGDLDRALEYFEESSFLSPGAVDTVVSIYCWFALAWRPAYAAIRYAFIWLDLNRKRDLMPVSSSLKSDFSRMRGFLPFIHVRLGRKLLPFLPCQDAAGPAPGSVQGPTGSFSLALGFPSRADLCLILHLTNLRRRTSGSYAVALERVTSEASATSSHDFPFKSLFPLSVFDSVWVQLLAGRWHAPEHIHLGEFRALLLWHKILGRVREFRGTLFADLGDNQTVSESHFRGRSPKYDLDSLCLQRASYEAATDIQGYSPWVPSARQPGGWGTRGGLDATILAASSGRPLLLDLVKPVCILVGEFSHSTSPSLGPLVNRVTRKSTARLCLATPSQNINFNPLLAGGQARLLSHLQQREADLVVFFPVLLPCPCLR